MLGYVLHQIFVLAANRAHKGNSVNKLTQV
jgi:hypothetical protein